MTDPIALHSSAPRAPDTTSDAGPALVLDIEGFEGPLDLLLTLARSQKVDLRRISVLQLAEQYLQFVEEVRAMRIELAADYLVMASWLAYLKSRLLLPPEPGEAGPSGPELAAHLAFQLERLHAMREAAQQLMARDRKGIAFFARGAPETLQVTRRIVPQATLLDLMRAYARLRTRDDFRPYAFDRRDVYALDDALARLQALIGTLPDWQTLERFLPPGWADTPARRRSATASTFAASLELVRQGHAELRQTPERPAPQLRCRTDDGE